MNESFYKMNSHSKKFIFVGLTLLTNILLSTAVFAEDNLLNQGQLDNSQFSYESIKEGYRGTFTAWQEPLPAEIVFNNSSKGNNKISELFSFYVNHRKLPIDWDSIANGVISIKIPKELQLIGENSFSIKALVPFKKRFSINIDYQSIDFNKVYPPEKFGLSPDITEQLNKTVEQDVNNGFPGATLMIIKDGHLVYSNHFGHLSLLDKNGRDVAENNLISTDINTVYDLASLTKIYATTFSIMHMCYLNQINIDKPASDYAVNYNPAYDVTAKQLLNHSAGNPASIELYDSGIPGKPETKAVGWGKEYYSINRNRTKSIVYKFPHINRPPEKNVYSDIDFMILGFMIEDISGMTENQYAAKNIYAPLLSNSPKAFIGYRPLDHKNNPNINKIDRNNIASTTYQDPLIGGTSYRHKDINIPEHSYNKRRKTLMTGHVNDPKAYHSLNQVSGHAGLFGNIEAVAILAQTMLNGGGYGSTKLFNQAVINEFTEPSDTDESYAQGWRSAAAAEGKNLGYLFGNIFNNESVFGHDGWTGTFSVIDADHNMIIIGLTNKRNTSYKDINKYNNKNPNEYTIPRYGNIITMVNNALKDK